jgi:hypothetical protein
MTGLPSRPVRLPGWAVVAGVAAGSLAAVYAAVALGSPLVALALVAGAALAPVVVSHPKAALVLVIVVELTNASVVVGHRGPVSLFDLTLLAAVASLVAGVLRGSVRVVWAPLFVGGLVYLAAQAASLPLAREPAAGIGIVGGIGRDLLFLFVVTALMCSLDPIADRLTLVKTMVATLALLASLSLVQEFVFHNATSFHGFSNTPLSGDLGSVTGRHSGPFDDVNFWARILVLFLPLGLSLWAASAGTGGLRRSVWAGATVAIAMGTYLTQSRGALIATGVAVVVWLALAGGRYRRLLKLAPLGLVVLLLLPGVGSRLQTLGEIGAAGAEGGDPSLVGRLAAQQAGAAMFVDHPLLGVGTGNFELVEPDYQRNAGLVLSRVIAPHNLYLQAAAESGVLGLGAWLLFFGTGLAAAGYVLVWGARGEPEGRGPGELLVSRQERLVAAGIVAGLVGWGLASVFLHLANLRILMLVLALAAASKADVDRARRSLGKVGIPAPTAWGPAGDLPALRPPSGRRRWLGLAGRAAVAGALIAGFVALPVFRERRWTAQATAVVVAQRPEGPSADSYDYDVLTRDLLLPTYREIVRQPQSRAAAPRQPGPPPRDVDRLPADASPTGATLTVSATSPEPGPAREMATATLAQGMAYVDSLNRLFVLQPVPGAVPTVRPVTHVKVLPLAAAACAAAVAVLVLMRRQRSLMSAGSNTTQRGA